ncbi:hypothetical protein [Psychroflexus torquis]|uniref:hypothetical protein n=1 Tax=Psychroflexus torquis TaxID=57029 RepID=UPI0000D53791|nr:hypothetical protein [Psychroflexus torquis]
MRDIIQKLKQICFTDEIKTASQRLLKLDYSPQQVVGILKKHQEPSLSVENIITISGMRKNIKKPDINI